jgi:hypothetical protein
MEMGKKKMSMTVPKTRQTTDTHSTFDQEFRRVQEWTKKAGISNQQMNAHLKGLLNKFRENQS